MINNIVTEGQSLLDLALQELGTVDGLFELADANSMAITDTLVTGQVLGVPASATYRPDVVAVLAGRRINTGDVAAPAPAASQLYFSYQFFNPATYA